MRNFKILAVMLLAVIFTVSSCKKDNDDEINPNGENMIDIPDGLDNSDIKITNYFENTSPNSDGDFEISASNILIATNTNTGKIIYISIISTQKNSTKSVKEEPSYQLNAKETAIALALNYLPYGYLKATNETFASIKNVIYSLESVKNLETAIASNVNKNGNLNLDELTTELQTVANFMITELDLSKNKSTNTNSSNKYITTKSTKSQPYLLNDRYNGVRLDIGSSVFNETSNTWKLNCTAYNENGIYLGLGKGWFSNDGLAYWNTSDIKYYVPPMNVGKFAGTFTSWSGLKDYFIDTKLLFTEGLSHFDDMTWDKAKLENIELEVSKTNNAIVVLSPEIDDKTMLINFIYQSIGIVDILVDAEGFNAFVYKLMSDTYFMLLMKTEYNNGMTGFTRIASEICDKFKDFLVEESQNLLIPDADAAIEHVLIIKKTIETGGNLAGMLFSWLTYESFAFQVIAEYNTVPVPTDGLIAYYPFNGNANDLSGNGNNGTVNGNVLLTSDRKGNGNSAYDFPGIAYNYISVPHHQTLALNNFTINAWIYTTTDYGYGQIVQKNRDINSGHYGLYINCVVGKVNYTNNVQAVSATNPSIGEWHMITGSVSGNNAKFYIDGVLMQDSIAPNNFVYSGSDNLAIGMHYYSGVPSYWTYPFKGKIDDIRIYNRQLNNDEVQALYNE